MKCLYCDQIMKESNVDLFHDSCRKVFWDKAVREQSSRENIPGFLEVVVIRGNRKVKVKVCRECLHIVGEKEIEKIKNFIEDKKLRVMKGLCLSCTKDRWRSTKTKEEKDRFLMAMEMRGLKRQARRKAE